MPLRDRALVALRNAEEEPSTTTIEVELKGILLEKSTAFAFLVESEAQSRGVQLEGSSIMRGRFSAFGPDSGTLLVRFGAPVPFREVQGLMEAAGQRAAAKWGLVPPGQEQSEKVKVRQIGP